MHPFVLFDIDGTLLHTSGQSPFALAEALSDTYGFEPDHDGVLMDGKTERRIAWEFCQLAGLTVSQFESKLPQLWLNYFMRSQQRLTPEVMVVYPGVRELLNRLAADERVTLGLVTGNVAASAAVKLTKADLLSPFVDEPVTLEQVEQALVTMTQSKVPEPLPYKVGSFGAAHLERTPLPQVALQLATLRSQRPVAPAEAIVIGDTPADVQCAKAHNVPVLAVATGKFGTDELAAEAPDWLLEDLSDVEQVLGIVGL